VIFRATLKLHISSWLDSVRMIPAIFFWGILLSKNGFNFSVPSAESFKKSDWERINCLDPLLTQWVLAYLAYLAGRGVNSRWRDFGVT
ncbi:MAG: hypothetical protein ACKPKW_28870, partial [Dolichospermum sp.]